MKPAMIRTMDSQGRIIIPHEIRRTMNLSGGDTIEIRTVENGVLLSKYKSASAGDRSMKNISIFFTPLPAAALLYARKIR